MKREGRGILRQAIVDAYGESEQIIDWLSMIEENLAVPFETTVFGVQVTVERVGLDRTATRSSQFADAAVRDSRSPSSIYYRQRHDQMVQSGSRRTSDGVPKFVAPRRPASQTVDARNF